MQTTFFILLFLFLQIPALALNPEQEGQIHCLPCTNCPKKVESFDLTTINSNAKGYAGTVTDGKYVYYVPNYFGSETLVARYDSSKDFDSENSWSFFNIHTLGLKGLGYAGAEFDGRYIYFAPHNTSKGSYHGAVLRYDTKLPFDKKSSWKTFDLTQMNSISRGYIGTGFDGNYIYLIPYGGGVNPYIAKYDVSLNFTDPSSWEIFDTSLIDSSSRGFIDSVFDGRYLYLSPYHNGLSYHGKTLRYDTKLPFNLSSSWKIIDLVQQVNPAAAGYDGAVANGEYIYYVPYKWGNKPHAYMVRFNTSQPFAKASSWEFFDASVLCPGCTGYIGAGTDGRYVYYSPKRNNNAFHGNMLKYDSKLPFTKASSWQVVKIDDGNSSLRDFDGDITKLKKYIYLSPNGHPATGFGTWHGNAVRYLVE
ncbi:MAG: hypothetical protein QNJ31_09585 [Candidatus Caenarcaniphilales bacterium]|nr:hypothetical protein [Candidatus Caenarcaniphilales bacterium]